MEQRRNPLLIARLFDLTFSHFIALSLVRIVYFLLMIAGLVLLGILTFYLFQVGQKEGAILVLVAGPVFYLVYLLIIRLVCETLIVVFAIAEDLGEMREAFGRLADKERASPS